MQLFRAECYPVYFLFFDDKSLFDQEKLVLDSAIAVTCRIFCRNIFNPLFNGTCGSYEGCLWSSYVWRQESFLAPVDRATLLTDEFKVIHYCLTPLVYQNGQPMSVMSCFKIEFFFKLIVFKDQDVNFILAL